ncbi:MAG TPA: DUF1998 domain-containing protein, partial [Baekduia sp.]|nr:DUF1998 domain-containing protein [Baekduia sp.]
AFIPARKLKGADDGFLSRPRFLAITEFGPRSIIYHEGARYECNKVILPPSGEEGLPLSSAKLCQLCGHLHEITVGGGPDLCERCGASLAGTRLDDMLRLQNVATRRRDRISSDEEERQRQGYEVRTGVRCEGSSGHRTAEVFNAAGEQLARLDYGNAATIWRVNLGWARRAEKDIIGFGLDTKNGYWKSNDQAPLPDPDDPVNEQHIKRVIPFVEDRRNCLLIEPVQSLDAVEMASLQAALKRGIQAVSQLEDQELAVEPLPDPSDRRLLLLFESAEGGAGVLRRLLDPGSLAAVAREALAICHFDPDSGDDRGRADGADEACEAACYDCLLSYGNQRDHRNLDRQQVRDTLLALAGATVKAAPGAAPPSEHLANLEKLCDSQLERDFLKLLVDQGRQLPSHAQKLYPAAASRPDFVYQAKNAAVFIDGPHHQDAFIASKDADARQRLEWEYAMRVIVFPHDGDWPAILDAHVDIFGANGAAG